jgi:hypothetical protein
LDSTRKNFRQVSVGQVRRTMLSRKPASQTKRRPQLDCRTPISDVSDTSPTTIMTSPSSSASWTGEETSDTLQQFQQAKKSYDKIKDQLRRANNTKAQRRMSGGEELFERQPSMRSSETHPNMTASRNLRNRVSPTGSRVEVKCEGPLSPLARLHSLGTPQLP